MNGETALQLFSAYKKPFHKTKDYQSQQPQQHERDVIDDLRMSPNGYTEIVLKIMAQAITPLSFGGRNEYIAVINNQLRFNIKDLKDRILLHIRSNSKVLDNPTNESLDPYSPSNIQQILAESLDRCLVCTTLSRVEINACLVELSSLKWRDRRPSQIFLNSSKLSVQETGQMLSDYWQQQTNKPAIVLF
ncbi:hypothetical protein HDU76_011922 [Blyttiomyces sp. JEL0837]|nr:hypothetical protein HDU76_011922 [Blyttiomyces sp. JEL0837]